MVRYEWVQFPDARTRAVSQNAQLIATIRRDLILRTIEKRLPHVLGVEGMCLLLAKRWGVDPTQSLLAALLHDIAKSEPREVQKARLEDCRVVVPTKDDRHHPAVWHGLIAAQEAADTYGIQDRDILEAVAFHPTGAPGMADVGLLLYVADFIEPSRNWPGVEEVRARAMKGSLVDAVKVIGPHKVRFLREKGKSVHPRTEAMIDWLSSLAAPETGKLEVAQVVS